MPEFTYEIVESVAVLSENPKGWTKELNLISWNGRDPKYDIREWAPDHEKNGQRRYPQQGRDGCTSGSCQKPQIRFFAGAAGQPQRCFFEISKAKVMIMSYKPLKR